MYWLICLTKPCVEEFELRMNKVPEFSTNIIHPATQLLLFKGPDVSRMFEGRHISSIYRTQSYPKCSGISTNVQNRETELMRRVGVRFPSDVHRISESQTCQTAVFCAGAGPFFVFSFLHASYGLSRPQKTKGRVDQHGKNCRTTSWNSSCVFTVAMCLRKSRAPRRPWA